MDVVVGAGGEGEKKGEGVGSRSDGDLVVVGADGGGGKKGEFAGGFEEASFKSNSLSKSRSISISLSSSLLQQKLFVSSSFSSSKIDR